MRETERKLTFLNAVIVGIGVSIVAAIIAFLSHESGFLSTIPPMGADGMPPQVDVAEDQRFNLYMTAFTAWAALVLFVAATVNFCLFGSTPAWRFWWTAGYVAFVIHMAWAVLVFFGGDIGAVMTSTRVSAPVPGFLLLVWWGVDVLLAWIGAKGRLVTIQRVVLHIGAFILFIGGSAVTGETGLIKLIGRASAMLIVLAIAKRVFTRS